MRKASAGPIRKSVQSRLGTNQNPAQSEPSVSSAGSKKPLADISKKKVNKKKIKYLILILEGGSAMTPGSFRSLAYFLHPDAVDPVPKQEYYLTNNAACK